MKKYILFFFVFCISLNNFGQNVINDQQFDIVNHEVKPNESVLMLSKKYLVDPAEIYRLNRFAINGLSEGMVLQIPILRKDISIPNEMTIDKPSPEVTQNSTETKIEDKEIVKQIENSSEKESGTIDNSIQINHVVQPKETIYGLSKKYDVSVDEIKLNNQELLKEGLKIGQVIRIPSKSSLKSSDSTDLPEQQNPKLEIKHKVEPKETLYALSKKYNVSVDEIKQQNESLLQKGLQIGQILIIKRNN